MPTRELSECPEALVDGLSTPDHSIKLLCARKIKNSVIGNKTKKACFMVLGVIPRLVDLLEEKDSSVELVQEVVVTLGSFCHGTSDIVSAILATRALPLLIRGLGDPNVSVVCACVRTLRALYSSGLAPSSPIFTDPAVAKQLVTLLSGPPAISQCAAIVLHKACQSSEHQNLLCSLGIISVLYSVIKSGITKSVQCSLCCLSSVIYENKTTSKLVVKFAGPDCSMVDALLTIAKSCPSNECRLAAAQCVSYLCVMRAIDPATPLISSVTLPCLMRLCRREFPSALKTPAIRTLAYLTTPHQSLQVLCAESDQLIATLVQYLDEKPDTEDELVTRAHEEEWDRLCEVVFLALSSLASSVEEVRIKVSSEPLCLELVTVALRDRASHIRVAAGKCLHSLTRSTKLLRTDLIDAEVWRPCLEMLSSSEDGLVAVATGVMCNLLLAFSPSKEHLVEGGAIERLSALSFHDNPTIQLNSVWAIMSASYDCDENVRDRVIKSFGFQRIFRLCSPRQDPKVVMKALGILINIIHDIEDTDTILSNHGDNIVSVLVSLLCNNPSNEIQEQVLCVLVNITGLSLQGRNLLVANDDLMRCISNLLHNSTYPPVQLASCQVIKNLADSALPDHIHRQNCLEEYGVKIALQRLEKNGNLEKIVKEALEHFMTSCL